MNTLSSFPLLLVTGLVTHLQAAPAAPPPSPQNLRITMTGQPAAPVIATSAPDGRTILTPTGVTSRQAVVSSNQSDALVRSNNIVSGRFGMADVQGLILDLQNTIELALPVLGNLTAGHAGVDPTTGLPRQFVNTAQTGRTPASYAGMAGTNAVQLDPQTYQTLIVLQNQLQQTRQVLRDLNAAERLAAPQNAQSLTPTGVQPPASPPIQVAPQNPARPAQRPVAPGPRILHPAGQ